MSTHNQHLRPQLKNAKSTFVMNNQMNNHSTITDDRVREYLRTEILVKEWIETVLQIKLTDNLYESLRNGVALCYLINSIREGIVPTVIDNPKAKDFHFQGNVVFLIMALEDLDIPKYKLFRVNDLFEGENMVRVIMCLVELSKHSSIPMKPMNSQIPVQLPTNEALVYLKSLLAQIRDPSKATKGPKRMGTNILKAQIALLAGPDFDKCEKGVLKFQSIWRGYKERKTYKKLKRDIAHRERVVKEILKTETDYVDNLKRCIDGYMEPLSKVLSKDQIKNIFSDIKIIKDFGIKILALLNEKVKDWKTYQKVGDAFILIAEVLKVYTSYVQNFNVALTTLDEVRKIKSTLALIIECRDGAIVRGFEISAFLIMPIQRVPRYSMLLTDLVKHTVRDHPDYESLVKSEEKMKSITSYLNEKKREGENLVKFSEIQSSLIGKVPQLCTPSRRFIKEGLFTDSNKKKQDIMVYLFNDIIVYGKPSSNKRVKFQGLFELSNAQLVDDTPLGFHIQETIETSDKPIVTLSLTAKSDSEKSDWKNEINQNIKLLKSNQKSIDIKLNPLKVEEQEKLAASVNQTLNPVVETKSIEEQLQERKKNKGSSMTNSVTSNSPQSPNTSTSVSLPNSPLHSSQDQNNSTPTSPQPIPNQGANLNSSFISSLFSGHKKKSNRDTLPSPSSSLSSSPNSTPNSPPTSSTTTTTSTTSTNSEDEPTSPNNKSAAKNNRPVKGHKKSLSKDDSDIGKSTEEGNRSRSSTQSRLSKLAGTLTFRRKKNTPLEIPENYDGSITPNEPIQPLPTIKIESIPEEKPIDLSQSLPTKLNDSNLRANNNHHNSKENSPSSTVSSSPNPQRFSNSPKNSRFSTENKRNSGSTTPINTTEISSTSEPAVFTIMEKLLSFDEIQSQKAELDRFKLECYLSNDDFKEVFSVDRDQFYRYPKWKQEKLKMGKKLL